MSLQARCRASTAALADALGLVLMYPKQWAWASVDLANRKAAMFDKAFFQDLWLYTMLVAPAPVGALIGLKYAKEQSKRARAISFVCSCFLGVICAGLTSEMIDALRNRPFAIAMITVVSASVSMEVMAGVQALVRGFSTDPMGWIDKMMGFADRFIDSWRKARS